MLFKKVKKRHGSVCVCEWAAAILNSLVRGCLTDLVIFLPSKVDSTPVMPTRICISLDKNRNRTVSLLDYRCMFSLSLIFLGFPSSCPQPNFQEIKPGSSHSATLKSSVIPEQAFLGPSNTQCFSPSWSLLVFYFREVLLPIETVAMFHRSQMMSLP